jgi:hypothetical protein
MKSSQMRVVARQKNDDLTAQSEIMAGAFLQHSGNQGELGRVLTHPLNRMNPKYFDSSLIRQGAYPLS